MRRSAVVSYEYDKGPSILYYVQGEEVGISVIFGTLNLTFPMCRRKDTEKVKMPKKGEGSTLY